MKVVDIGRVDGGSLGLASGQAADKLGLCKEQPDIRFGGGG